MKRQKFFRKRKKIVFPPFFSYFVLSSLIYLMKVVYVDGRRLPLSFDEAHNQKTNEKHEQNKSFLFFKKNDLFSFQARRASDVSIRYVIKFSFNFTLKRLFSLMNESFFLFSAMTSEKTNVLFL